MDDLSKRTLTIERTLDASVEVVWEAWTNPEHLAQWWGRGMPVKVIHHDFRVGGAWKYVMAMPDGMEFTTEGVYAEIVEHEKIVTSADFKPMTEGVIMQVLFKAAGKKTLFTFHVIHPTEEYCKQQEKMGFYNGWGSVFTRMNDFVSSLKPQT